MKKIFLTALASIFSLSMFAAPPVFSVKAPTWTQVAVPQTDGLNIRKYPSTSAPKLMYDEMSLEDYDTPVIYFAKWVSKPTKYMVTIPFDAPMPIISEKNGWYEVWHCGPSFKENGWINAKYAKAQHIQRLSSSNLPTERFAWIDRGDDGIYMIDLQYNDMEGSAVFRIGRLIDGVVISPYMLDCPTTAYEENGKPQLRKNNDYFEFVYNKACSSPDYEYDPMASKLSQELLEEIIKYAEPAPEAVYFMVDEQIYFAL